MEHQDTVAAQAAPAPAADDGSTSSAATSSERAAPTSSEPSDNGEASGTAGSTTGARRRRRRGGRGRGGASRTATTSDGSTAGDEPSLGEADGEAASSKVASSKPAPSKATTSKAASSKAASSKAAADDADGPDASAPTPRPRQPRSRPPRKPADSEPNAGGSAAGEPSASDTSPAATVSDGDAAPAGTTTRTSSGARRRRRGGRGRGGGGGARPARPAAPDADAIGTDTEGEAVESLATQRDDATPDAAAPDVAADADADAGGTAATASASSRSRSRNRRRRSGSSSTTAVAAETEATETSETAVTPAADGEPTKQRRPARQSQKQVEEQIAAGGPTRGIKTTRSRTGRDGRRRREPVAPPPRVTDKLMVITEHGDRDQIAVLEEDVLVQHYVTRQGATSMVGNIYLGRVQNVLPGMEAAFVDVGRGRNGVLYAGEVNYSPEDVEGPAPRIEQILKPGQAVMVQVTKDPMGGKGARLTANLSLAGRYLVLAPNQSLSGISRRLSDDARRKLKTILKKLKPDEHGVIVRTAAEGASEEAITADLERLLRIWDDIQKQAQKMGSKKKAPNVLYEEPELTVRVVRDLFTDEEYRGLVTDSRRVYDKVMDYVREIAPDLEPKVTLHTGGLPAFEEHRVVEQIHKALDRKVWLPSGGYLIVERTEAMTIVDVNTGKAVGKTNLEETVVNTNLEAAREVARQLRLRDIGGIIVIDFIDMLLEKNKKQVEDTMREALAIDKTRSQVFEIGPLGLMQVTRKRVSSGLVESFSETCPACEGRGIVVNYEVD